MNCSHLKKSLLMFRSWICLWEYLNYFNWIALIYKQFLYKSADLAVGNLSLAESEVEANLFFVQVRLLIKKTYTKKIKVKICSYVNAIVQLRKSFTPWNSNDKTWKNLALQLGINYQLQWLSRKQNKICPLLHDSLLTNWDKNQERWLLSH